PETGDREDVSAHADRRGASLSRIQPTDRQDRRHGELMFRTLTLLVVSTLVSFAAHAATFKPGAPTVIITGANRAIGLELAKQYAGLDWNVIATSRRPPDDKGLGELAELAKTHKNVAIERIDVSDTAMIRGVAQKYRDQPIDVLINNAANVEASFQADMEKV